MEMLLFYSLCCPCLCVSSSRVFPIYLVSRLIPNFYGKIPIFKAIIPCYIGFYVRYCVWCATGGGGYLGWRGGILVLIHVFKSGVQFNLPTRLPIPDPSPAPVTTGDWGAKIRGSFVNRTSQQRLRLYCLPTTVIAKGDLPFSLP